MWYNNTRAAPLLYLFGAQKDGPGDLLHFRSLCPTIPTQPGGLQTAASAQNRIIFVV